MPANDRQRSESRWHAVETGGQNANRVREYFAGVACDWDRMRERFFTEGVRDTALARALLSRNAIAVDIGSGTGFIAAALAPMVSHVICIDSSEEMLRVARHNLGMFQNVDYRVGDGTAIPLDDSSVDAALANMYLHHVDDPPRAVAEIARVLRPGGRLVITDMDTHTHEWMRKEMADVWLGFERPQVERWLADAGFDDVTVDGTGET
jgi:arsenite methyltransferase